MADITSNEISLESVRFYIDGLKADAINLNKPIQDLKLRDFIQTKGLFEEKAGMMRLPNVGGYYMHEHEDNLNLRINKSSLWTAPRGVTDPTFKDAIFVGSPDANPSRDNVMNLFGYNVTIPMYDSNKGFTNAWGIQYPEAPKFTNNMISYTGSLVDIVNAGTAISGDWIFDSSISTLVTTPAERKITLTSTNLTGLHTFASHKIEVERGVTYFIEMRVNNDSQTADNVTRDLQLMLGTNSCTLDDGVAVPADINKIITGDEIYASKVYERAQNEYITLRFTAPADVIYGTIINKGEAQDDAITVSDINLIPVADVEREDLTFMEIWKEDILEKGVVYPYGMVQYEGSDTSGVTGIAKGSFVGADTYSLFGGWQTPGEIVGNCYVWDQLDVTSKLKLIENANNNLYLDGDTVIQLRWRIRTIPGKDLISTNLFKETENYLALHGEADDANTLLIRAQGKNVTELGTVYFDEKANATGVYSTKVSDFPSGFMSHGDCAFVAQDYGTVTDIAYEGFCMSIPVAKTTRRNSGLFHPMFNKNGTAGSTMGEWFEPTCKIESYEDCYLEDLLQTNNGKGTNMVVDANISYDENGAKYPTVLRIYNDVETDYEYKMYYVGYDALNNTAIMRATKEFSGGILSPIWVKQLTPAITTGITEDAEGMSSPSAIIDATTEKIWYVGADASGNETIIYTYFDNNWIKVPTNITNSTAGVSIDSLSVIKDGSTYKMWYSKETATAEPKGIYYATSTDGATFVEHGLVMNVGDYYKLDKSGLKNPTVAKDSDGSYKMFYSGFDGLNWRGMYASSNDGMTWVKEGLVIPLGENTTTDDTHIGKVAFAKGAGKYMIWYDAEDGVKHRIHDAEFDLNGITIAGDSNTLGIIEGSDFVAANVDFEYLNNKLRKGGVDSVVDGGVFQTQGAIGSEAYRNDGLFFDHIDNSDIYDMRLDVAPIMDNADFFNSLITKLGKGQFRGQDSGNYFRTSEEAGKMTIVATAYKKDEFGVNTTSMAVYFGRGNILEDTVFDSYGDVNILVKHPVIGHPMFDNRYFAGYHVKQIPDSYVIADPDGKFGSLFAGGGALEGELPNGRFYEIRMAPSYGNMTQTGLSSAGLAVPYVTSHKLSCAYNNIINKTLVFGDFNYLPNNTDFNGKHQFTYDASKMNHIKLVNNDQSAVTVAQDSAFIVDEEQRIFSKAEASYMSTITGSIASVAVGDTLDFTVTIDPYGLLDITDLDAPVATAPIGVSDTFSYTVQAGDTANDILNEFATMVTGGTYNIATYPVSPIAPYVSLTVAGDVISGSSTDLYPFVISDELYTPVGGIYSGVAGVDDTVVMPLGMFSEGMTLYPEAMEKRVRITEAATGNITLDVTLMIDMQGNTMTVPVTVVGSGEGPATATDVNALAAAFNAYEPFGPGQGAFSADFSITAYPIHNATDGTAHLSIVNMNTQMPMWLSRDANGTSLSTANVEYIEGKYITINPVDTTFGSSTSPFDKELDYLGKVIAFDETNTPLNPTGLTSMRLPSYHLDQTAHTLEILELRNGQFRRLAPSIDFDYQSTNNIMEYRVDSVPHTIPTDAVFFINYKLSTPFAETDDNYNEVKQFKYAYVASDEGAIYPDMGARLKETLLGKFSGNTLGNDIFTIGSPVKPAAATLVLTEFMPNMKYSLVVGGTVAVDDVFSVIVNGKTYSYTATGTTVAEVAAGLASVIDDAEVEVIAKNNMTIDTVTFHADRNTIESSGEDSFAIFEIGDTVNITGSASNNNSYTVLDVTESYIVVDGTVVDELTEGTAVTFTSPDTIRLVANKATVSDLLSIRGFKFDTDWIFDADRKIVHDPITILTDTNVGYKMLPFVAKDGNNLKLSIFYTELYWDEARMTWGDDGKMDVISGMNVKKDKNTKPVRYGLKTVDINKLF